MKEKLDLATYTLIMILFRHPYLENHENIAYTSKPCVLVKQVYPSPRKQKAYYSSQFLLPPFNLKYYRAPITAGYHDK